MEGNKHKINIAHNDVVNDNGKLISLASREQRDKYKEYERIKEKKIHIPLKQRYKTPPKLIEELFECIKG